MTLDTGATYWAPASVKLSSFKVGQKVDVTYTQANGKMEISAVKPSA
jgi:Cu/Ag efflux protein CusF